MYRDIRVVLCDKLMMKVLRKLHFLNRRRLKWDTVSQPENNLSETEIQLNFPENCQISALFRL